MSTRDVLKVARDRPELSLVTGDFLVVGSDGLPLCLIRKFDPETAEQTAQALGLTSITEEPR